MGEETFYSASVKALLVYTLVISLALYIFGAYQLCGLGLDNIASNEDIRGRWNGNRNNKKNIRIFYRKSSCCSKLRFQLFSKISESKVQKYAELCEVSEKIEILRKGNG